VAILSGASAAGHVKGLMLEPGSKMSWRAGWVQARLELLASLGFVGRLFTLASTSPVSRRRVL